MKLANKQFVRGCEATCCSRMLGLLGYQRLDLAELRQLRQEIGFSGCLTTLWRQLDHDGSGELCCWIREVTGPEPNGTVCQLHGFG